MRRRITECCTLSPAPRLLVPGASFSVHPTTPATRACAAFYLVFLYPLTLSRPTPSASGSEPRGRIGSDPTLLVRSLCLSHQENAPAASPAAQEPGPAQCRSGQRLQEARKGRELLGEEIGVSTIVFCMFESKHTELFIWSMCCYVQYKITLTLDFQGDTVRQIGRLWFTHRTWRNSRNAHVL